MPSATSIIVSTLALLFTVFSFWWMNWRPGKLEVGDLRHFAVGKAREGPVAEPNVVIVTLPLILFNAGARPLVVESLRLVSREGTLGTLDFEAVDSHIGNANPGERVIRDHFYLPVSLKPNEVIKQNFVFERRTTEFSYGNLLYHLHLEAKLSQRRDWVKLKDVELDFRDGKKFSTLGLNIGYQVFHYGQHGQA